MTGLRYVALVALAVWVGGLVALGTVAAPALFAAIEAQNTPGGRELAGVLFGAVFSRFQYLAWALGLALLISLGARAALGPRPRRFAVRMWTVTAMLAGSLLATFFITPPLMSLSGALTPAEAMPAWMQPVVDHLNRGNKIGAIKAYRDATGVGLAEAKATVEALERQLANEGR